MPPDLMEIRHLRTFITVAETLNISAAARRLRVTQPALSRQLQILEHLIGCPLFVRERKGLVLTSAGHALRDDALNVIAAVDTALRNARGVPRTSVVRLGYYGSSIWEPMLAPVVEAFGRRYPQATLALREEPSVLLANRLREGILDVALLAAGDYKRIRGVITEVACRVPAMAVMAANHRLAKRRAVALEDLRDEPIIGFTRQDAPGRYRGLIAACLKAGFTPQISYVASIFPEICVAVKRQMGVAILSAFAEASPHPGVVFVKLKPPGLWFDVYVARTLAAPPEATDLAQRILTQAQRVSAGFEKAFAADT
jgi:DNA-binding transcriptional LysR family regulator